MQIIFLGTSCAKPTKERNHSSFFLSYGSEGILFDCGEGTQRQLIIAGIKPTKVNKILISHWHGDHVLGLGGLMQTLALSEYTQTLRIYGPEGTIDHINHLKKSMAFDDRLNLEVKEVEGKFYDGSKYSLIAEKIDHGIPAIGYRFVEKNKRKIKVSTINKLGIPEGPLLGELQDGKKIKFKGKTITPEETTTIVKGKIIAYVADSTINENSLKLAQDADILITDSTYSHKMEEQAIQYKHMTAKQGAMIASQANAKKLILTHFSTRYKETSELREEAEEIFPEVICAEDFMKITI